MDRRDFLSTAAAAATLAATSSKVLAADSLAGIPIIDTHVHLFDPNRPQGVPALIPTSPTATTGAMPDGYKKMAMPHGIVGFVEVEASNWIEDNLWVLEICADQDFMVGMVGNINPEVPEFGEYLDRFQRNPLFRGIRYGNLWNYDMVSHSRDKTVIDRLKLLAQADLIMDTANPVDVPYLEAVMRISDAIPDLRIMIDHLPTQDPTPQTMAAYEKALRELNKRPNVFCKVSGIIHYTNGKASTRLADHKVKLDRINDAFGEDRVVFGSDWPHSDDATTFDNVVRIAKEYYATKSRAAAEKYFWKNSVRAYKWVHRAGNQPKLG